MFGHMVPIWLVVAAEFVLAYSLEMLMGSPCSFKLAAKVFNVKTTNPFLFETAVICATVGLMCPAMSLIAALCVYPKDKEACFEMLTYLHSPRGLSVMDKQFIQDRFRDKDYVSRSYFVGATPDNNYEPSQPYTIKFFENPYARQNIDEGYLTLQVESGGADSPRQIRLRTKPSTGEWFLWEQFILSDIRPPKSADPWA